MLDEMFYGVFDTDMTEVIPVSEFLLCVGCALAIGLFQAFAYSYHTRYTRSFAATLALLPAVVCVIIMMVNGNVGSGVAVAGAFSLIRFRSVPGTAKEIGAILLAMGAGIATGMGYLGYAVLFALLLGGVSMLYSRMDFGANRGTAVNRVLHITIPGDLDYTSVFESLLPAYTDRWELVSVKTTNMGSMFRLAYEITLKSPNVEKELIDNIRCRNGNLEVSISRQDTSAIAL